MSLDSIQENILCPTSLCKGAFFGSPARGRVANRNVREDQTNILASDVAISVEVIHVEGQLDLRFEVAVVDLEETMHKFYQINIVSLT